MTFVHSKGYLVRNDLPWEAQEYLRGSEHVNHVAAWQAGDLTLAVYATDADLVGVIIEDPAGGRSNTLAGWCRLAGGFSRVTHVGGFLYAVSKADARKLYRLRETSLNGDSTNRLELILDAADPAYDVHGERIGDRNFLYLAVSEANGHRVEIREASEEGLTQARIARVGNSRGCGGFPQGRFGQALYWAHSGQLYVKYNPENINTPTWQFDCSYGAVEDDFAGTEVNDAKWLLGLTGNMAGCFTQDDGLRFNTSSPAGSAQASATYLALCVGDISRRFTVDVEEWPILPGQTDDVFVGLEMTSLDGRARYTLQRGYRATDMRHYVRAETHRDGGLVDAWEAVGTAQDFMNPMALALGREPRALSGKEIHFDHSYPAGGMNSHVFQDADGDDAPLICRILVHNTTGRPFRGKISDFKPYDLSPAIYDRAPDAPITAGGVSPILSKGERVIALGFGERGIVVRTNEGSLGGASEAAAEVSAPFNAASSLVRSGRLAAACVSDDGAWALFGGDEGVDHLDGRDASALALLRHYDTAHDHAQPLTWRDVRALDWAGEGFAYGTLVSRGGGYGDPYDPYDPYAPYGGFEPSGGGGWIKPDFDAPLGSDAFAYARGHEITTGANTPLAAPADYLHTHVERRLKAGGTLYPWQRLQATGWTDVAPGAWDHGADVAFHRDAVLGDIGVCVQDEELDAGRWEYRWIFHDEAGNEGRLPARTAYGDDSEYLGTPHISGLAVNGGGGPTRDRGVEITLSAHSGSPSGSVEDRVLEARFWNDGESEADSPWREYRAGCVYSHLLRDQAGLRTVNARVQHECGDASSAASATIEYSPGETAAAGEGTENAMIAFGGASGFNFTGDGAAVSATSEEDGFPASLTQQDDLSAPWKSHGLGVGTVQPGSNRVQYEASILFDLGVRREVKLFAILGHNFGEVYENVYEIEDFQISLSGYDLVSGAPSNVISVELGAMRNRAVILHRPLATRRYWRLTMSLSCSTLTVMPLDLCWSIGRIVLNERALCCQPAHNFDEGLRLDLRDPSRVAETAGQARRVVELRPYRDAELNFRSLTPEEAEPLTQIWERQRQVRPVLVILDPEKISGNLTAPSADDPEPTAIYGYLGERLQVTGAGWNYVDVRMNVTEAAG